MYLLSTDLGKRSITSQRAVFFSQVASTAGGARYLLSNGHLDRLLVAAGGGDEGGGGASDPDPLLGTSALRTLAKVLAKAEGVGLEVSPQMIVRWMDLLPPAPRVVVRVTKIFALPLVSA